MQIDSSIFKAYDIRGVVDKTLTEEAARAIGQALGALAKEKSVDTMCVGRDGRLSGPKLSRALMEGITDMGIHVKSIGMTPTPVLYFAISTYQNPVPRLLGCNGEAIILPNTTA